MASKWKFMPSSFKIIVLQQRLWSEEKNPDLKRWNYFNKGPQNKNLWSAGQGWKLDDGELPVSWWSLQIYDWFVVNNALIKKFTDRVHTGSLSDMYMVLIWFWYGMHIVTYQNYLKAILSGFVPARSVPLKFLTKICQIVHWPVSDTVLYKTCS